MTYIFFMLVMVKLLLYLCTYYLLFYYFYLKLASVIIDAPFCVMQQALLYIALHLILIYNPVIIFNISNITLYMYHMQKLIIPPEVCKFMSMQPFVKQKLFAAV